MEPVTKFKKNQVFIPEKLEHGLNKYTYKHSGDIGDMIYSLPIIRFYGGGELHLNPWGLPSKKPDGSASGFNKATIKLVKPLLEAQEYITKVKSWNRDRVNVDLDYFRTNPVGLENLCENILTRFEVPFLEADKPWLTCNKKKIAPIVISRSFRYRNDNLNYKSIFENFKDCVFIGLEVEHSDFQERFGKIDFFPVRDFLEMAEVINGADLFIGNQSSPMAVAIGLGQSFWQEYYIHHADCIFNRKNGKYIRYVDRK